MQIKQAILLQSSVAGGRGYRKSALFCIDIVIMCIAHIGLFFCFVFVCICCVSCVINSMVHTLAASSKLQVIRDLVALDHWKSIKFRWNVQKGSIQRDTCKCDRWLIVHGDVATGLTIQDVHIKDFITHDMQL